MDYPQYRKYPNGRNFFKIISPVEMDEIHYVGSRCLVTRLEAKILPDRNLIYDLTFDTGNTAVAISREEYEERLKECSS